MNWSDLRYALVVAREGSVTEAAKVLGVAHTTVYRRVNGLEENHGVRFFDRTGASWSLTDAGRELLLVGAEVEQQFQHFERRLRGKDQRLEGRVSVATVASMGVQMARMLHRFRQAQPHIHVVLKIGNEHVEVGKEADIALRITTDPPEHLRGRKVATVGFAVYAAPSLLSNGTVDWSDAPWVCFEPGPTTPQRQFEAAKVADSKVILRTNHRVVFTEAVRLGTGIGILPCALAAEHPHLIRVSDVLPELGLPLWLLTHQDLAPMPRVRAMLEFLADEMVALRPLIEGTLEAE